MKNIQTLILRGLKLGDISILENLLSLKTLWLSACSIIELPSEFSELKKLRSLEVEQCKVKKNNPFEAIERCSQLEELSFVDNKCDVKEKEELSQNGSPLTLHRYCISSDDLSNYFEKYGSMSRCFQIDELSHLISDATFKQLVGRAELLILEGDGEQRIWKNLVPDLVAIDEEGTLNDLIILHLSSYPHMECLVNAKDHHSSVIVFRNLVELHVSRMDIENLCQGPMPSGVLEQLKIMNLEKCEKLRSIFSIGNFNICHLKSIVLEDCPMLTTIFHAFTAQSLRELKILTIRNCNELEHIIVGEDGDSNQKGSNDSLFPKLKTFQISKCNKLKIILPILSARDLASLEKISICEIEQLEYIFDKLQEEEDAILPSLKELEISGVPRLSGIFREYEQLKNSSMQKSTSPLSRHKSNEIHQSPTTCALSWVQACCSLNKSRPANQETNLAVSKHRPLDHTNPLGLHTSKKWIDTITTIGRQLFHVGHIKKMDLADFSFNSASTLFTLSMGSMILWEELTIRKCEGLKHLVTNDEDDYKDQKNCSYSIFPYLKNLEMRECNDMEFLFPSTISLEIKNLRSWTIRDAPKLTYMFGKDHHEDLSKNQNQQNEQHFDLPALEFLCFQGVPNVISICVKNYYFLVLPSLHTISLDNCGIESFNEWKFRTSEEHLDWKITKLTLNFNLLLFVFLCPS